MPKTVVHGLKREDFSVLVRVVIENLVDANDYRSSLIPDILVKHFKDLNVKDQERLMSTLRVRIAGWHKNGEFGNFVDRKYWSQLLETLETNHPTVKKYPIGPISRFDGVSSRI